MAEILNIQLQIWPDPAEKDTIEKFNKLNQH